MGDDGELRRIGGCHETRISWKEVGVRVGGRMPSGAVRGRLSL